MKRTCSVWCENQDPDGGPDGRSRPAHRDWLEAPAPQGFGAAAAIERDDRAAITERVPRCHPGSTGNKTCRTVQVGGGVHHTWRTGAGARAGSLPQRTAAAAHVPAAQRSAVRSPLLKTLVLRSPVTADAEMGGASATVASVAVVDIGGMSGAAGSRAKHAARRGNGTVRTAAGMTADERADAGARRSRHRRGSKCRGGEPGERRRECGTKRRHEHCGSAASSAGAVRCGPRHRTADRGGKGNGPRRVSDAARGGAAVRRCSAGPSCRAALPCRRGCR